MDKIKTILLTFVCLAAVSCMKEKREATYNTQESKIDQYISKNMYVSTTEDGKPKTDTLRVVYNGGASRLVTTEGIGEELKHDGTISFYYAGYSFTGNKSYSSMFTTNRQETATAAGWELSEANHSVYTVNLKETELIEGLRMGLTGVKSGEVCQILFSGKYGFGKRPLGTIPANSAILFEIWVEGVSNE